MRDSANQATIFLLVPHQSAIESTPQVSSVRICSDWHPEAYSEVPSEPRELKIVSIRLFIPGSNPSFEAVLKYKSFEGCHWLNITSFGGVS